MTTWSEGPASSPDAAHAGGVGATDAPAPVRRSGFPPLAILVLAILTTAAGLGAVGCAGREASEPALSDSAYVSVMARLTVIREASRRGPRSVPDSLVRRSVDSLLAEAGVDGEALLEFAREVGDEPERMAGIWERIQTAADSLRDDGWEPPGPVSAGDGTPVP